MIHRLLVAVLVGVFCVPVVAQEDDYTAALERGPHHAVIERVSAVLDEAGDIASVTNTFVQIEDGLNFWDPEKQAWVEAREEIEIVPGGAVAPYLQQKAAFSSNGNDANGALTLEIQGQLTLRSTIVALRYFDAATGADPVIAVAKDRLGELLPPNQVIYRDVLDEVHSDLVYTVRRGSIEADLVLREIPPDPADFGLNPETVLVEVIAEFFDPPEPTRRETVLSSLEDPQFRERVALPDWIDEELDFGPNRIVRGRAFAWSAAEAAHRDPSEFPPVASAGRRLPTDERF